MLFLPKSLYSFAIIISISLTAIGQPSGFFHTKGKDIIAPDGKAFLIKGTNLGNWLVPEGYMFKLGDVSSPRLINKVITELIGPREAFNFWKKFLDNYIIQDDIHYLKSIGVNSIRLPFNYRLFSKEYYMGVSDSLHGFVYMDRLINWCKKENIYILLDMHCAPGGQTGDNIDDGYGFPFLFDNEADIEQTASIWKSIAARYKNEKIIMGYDLLNEPIAHYYDSNHFNPLLEPVYKKIVKAIREVDKNHTIYLGGAQWNSNFKPFGKPFDDNMVYTFHKYWTPPTKAVIQDYIDFREKYNVPIYVGETGENTDGWVDSFRVVCEQNNVGWHFWPYKKMESTRGFASFAQPAGYDSVINYAGKPRTTFSDLRAARPKSMDDIRKSLDLLLQNIKFKNCMANEGYIKALGLNFKKIE
ncbi:MAG: cellulase family glycosylhydrolase [Ginsengibacter sp.]